MPRVALALPPLIESNFGRIFASTAVLAAHLEDSGVSCQQLDLNASFLDHILSEDELEAGSEGLYRRSTEISVAAATWTRRRLEDGSLSRSEFPPVEGNNPLITIMNKLAIPYSVDSDAFALNGSADDALLEASYDRFCARQMAPLLGDSARDDLLVGFSVPMGPQLFPALRLAAMLRTVTDGRVCRIVLGGPSLSLLGDAELTQLLESNPAVDCVVRYDGEFPLQALVEQMSAGEWAPERVPATSSVADGRVSHAEPGAGPKLNSLPTPRYDAGLIAAAPVTRLGVTQARGCYWGKCDYCDYVEVFKGSPAYRSRRPDLVVDDIRCLARDTGIRRYRIITESIPPAFSRRFSELLLEAELDIEWNSFVMVDKRFDIELLELMAAAGCDHLIVGLESMVTRSLRLVHKSADREENIRFLKDARTAGVKLVVNLIPDLPSTTRDEAMQGLRDLEELVDCLSWVQIFTFEATRSSSVGRSPETFGLVPIESIPKAQITQHAVNRLAATDPAMTPDEREEVHDAYRRFTGKVNASRLDPRDDEPYYYMSTMETPEGPALFNFATLERIQLSGPVAAA